MSNRRQFILTTVPVALALGTATRAMAQAKADENDPAAKGVGYKADASKVDKAKYPTYAKGQSCSNCQLYQGKAGDAAGVCPIVGGKLVAAGGWCQAYVKKA